MTVQASRDKTQGNVLVTLSRVHNFFMYFHTEVRLLPSMRPTLALLHTHSSRRARRVSFL